ncbi:MAG TPA: HupE / UreJ protein, partial [Gammaproteobacteria bacterium]|nr:HupE / UreJ protein [Gammaproteobacteria bacterium]
AGALGELGLRDSDIPLALLFFNLGVEGGQVVFIATMISANWFFGKFSSDGLISIHRGLAYGLGGIAFFWFLERLPALFVPS